MYFSSKQKRAFTLIEMLIVIVIIGILAAALIPRLQSVQGRARDSKRKVDLQSINTAIAIFHTDNGIYPVSELALYSSSTGGTSPWITGLANYMTSVPVDPINNIALCYAAAGRYCYGYHDDPVIKPNRYDLITILENGSDPERTAVKNYWYSFMNSGYTWYPQYQANLYDASPFRNSWP